MNKTFCVITGPTACGKTALSIRLAHALDGEIVSADSVQVYCHLDIGSAKPTPEEREGVPHHLLDCVEVDEPLSAAQYQRLAKCAIAEIQARGKMPIVVGGTGLYINALTTGLNFTGAAPDEAFRALWQKREAEEPGCAHRELLQCDPVTAKRLHPNDKKRVIRALEVLHLTGRPLSEQAPGFRQDKGSEDIRMIGLTMPRELLYARIDERVDAMIHAGLIEEVQGLLARYDRSLPSLQGLGYKEIAAYLAGECTKEEAIAAIKLGTRHFAKRQMTWFKRDARIHWLDVSQLSGEALFSAALKIITAPNEQE